MRTPSVIINGRFLTQPVTGVQRYAVEMTRALLRRNPDLQVVCPGHIVHQGRADELRAAVIGSGTGYYWEQIELPRYLRSLHPRPVLLNLANLAPLFYDRNVVVIHDTAPLRHPEWYSRRFALVYRYLMPRVARRALHVVTDSQFSAGEITELLDVERNRISVVPAAVGECFMDSPGDERTSRSGSYLLTVGSLDPRKNVATLIEAFLSLQTLDISLYIVGTASRVFASPRLTEAAGGNPHVRFLQGVTDLELKQLYRNATLFVYPSLYEGFGLPPLEAMACGCPCLVARSGSLPEVCGDAAAYFDLHDAESIARAIRSLLDNVAQRTVYRERGYQRAASYSWQDSAGALLDIALGLPNA